MVGGGAEVVTGLPQEDEAAEGSDGGRKTGRITQRLVSVETGGGRGRERRRVRVRRENEPAQSLFFCRVEDARWPTGIL